MNARTYGGSGRHALPAVKRPDGSDMVRLVKGSPDDIRKVLWRNGVSASWMDSQAIDEQYQGKHAADNHTMGIASGMVRYGIHWVLVRPDGTSTQPVPAEEVVA